MKQKTLIGIFILLLFLPLLNLFQSGFPLTHDGQDHVARIANFYLNLQEGNIVPRWAANLNWGYGHPILMFLYPLPSYLASLFHFIGFSFVDSTKLVFGTAFIFSILSMYLWLRSFLSEKAAVVGGLLYGYAPYHFVDLYVRGAIGELVAFIFPPLVLYFLFKLSQKNSYWYIFGGSLSLAGFILAHNAVSLMFFPIMILYATYLIWQSKKRIFLISQFSFLIFFGLCLSAFFWLPAFAEGKYTLRDIVTQSVYENRFVSLDQFFYGPWNYGQSAEFTLQIGWVSWLFVFSAIPTLFYFYNKKKKEWFMVAGLLVVFFTSLILMTSFSRALWDHVTLLQKFQFPWRLLFLTMFSSAVLGAICFSALPRKFQNGTMIVVIVLLILMTKNMWQAKTYFQKPETFYTGIYESTTDTGESAPIWSVRFMEQMPKAALEFISGEGIIQQGKRTTTSHQYTVTVPEKAQMRENTLYFPGWSIAIDGQQISIEFQDAHNRGVMTFWVEKGTHTVSVNFQETKLRILSNTLSIAGLFLLVLLGILKTRLWRN